MGGEYRFGCRLEGLDIADGRLRGVNTSSGFIPAQAVVLAIGHTAATPIKCFTRRAFPFRQKRFNWDCGSSIRRKRSIDRNTGDRNM